MPLKVIHLCFYPRPFKDEQEYRLHRAFYKGFFNKPCPYEPDTIEYEQYHIGKVADMDTEK